jgi:hypothetical protein
MNLKTLPQSIGKKWLRPKLFVRVWQRGRGKQLGSMFSLVFGRKIPQPIVAFTKTMFPFLIKLD